MTNWVSSNCTITAASWGCSETSDTTASTGWYPTNTTTSYYACQYSCGNLQLYSPLHSLPVETEQQKQARLEAQRQYDAEQERIREQRAEAKKRAEELLKSHIGLEAFGRLLETGYVELDSRKHAGRKYRVPANARNLIEVVDKKGKVIDRLCVHPSERYEDGDEILTRITLLKFAEDHILQVANHS